VSARVGLVIPEDLQVVAKVKLVFVVHSPESITQGTGWRTRREREWACGMEEPPDRAGDPDIYRGLIMLGYAGLPQGLFEIGEPRSGSRK
jgi:hypothetical protein